jgi:hypothetical protein
MRHACILRCPIVCMVLYSFFDFMICVLYADNKLFQFNSISKNKELCCGIEQDSCVTCLDKSVPCCIKPAVDNYTRMDFCQNAQRVG